jgi:hypothetical protein
VECNELKCFIPICLYQYSTRCGEIQYSDMLVSVTKAVGEFEKVEGQRGGVSRKELSDTGGSEEQPS